MHACITNMQNVNTANCLTTDAASHAIKYA